MRNTKTETWKKNTSHPQGKSYFISVNVSVLMAVFQQDNAKDGFPFGLLFENPGSTYT